MWFEQCLVTSEEVALTRACLMYEAVFKVQYWLMYIHERQPWHNGGLGGDLG